MKHSMLAIAVVSLFSSVAVSQEYMKVSATPIVSEKNEQCYQVKPGYSRKDTASWVPYCGKIENFIYEQGYEYTLYVEKYDPSAEVIKVIKTIGRDNSDSFRKQQELKKKKAASNTEGK